MLSSKKRALDGQVALVTGAGQGTGRATALALAARGVRVVVAGREERALAEVVGEIACGGGKARHVAGDVRDRAHLRAAVARAVEAFGALDIAVANVEVRSASDAARSSDQDEALADAVVQATLMGPYNTFAAAMRAVKGPGRLLAIDASSVTRGAAGYAAHYAARAGIRGLVRAVALEVSARGITCNALLGGGAIEAEVVAEVVLFLCSSAGGAITGQSIETDA